MVGCWMRIEKVSLSSSPPLLFFAVRVRLKIIIFFFG